jgi:hypothetical protein
VMRTVFMDTDKRQGRYSIPCSIFFNVESCKE